MLILSCASIPYNLVSFQAPYVALSILHLEQAALIVGTFHTFKGTGIPIARGCCEVADRLQSMSWNRCAYIHRLFVCISSSDLVAVQRFALQYQQNELLLTVLYPRTSGRRRAGLRSCKQCDRRWHHLVQDERYRLCRVDDDGEAIIGFVDASKWHVASSPFAFLVLIGAPILGVVYCL